MLEMLKYDIIILPFLQILSSLENMIYIVVAYVSLKDWSVLKNKLCSLMCAMFLKQKYVAKSMCSVLMSNYKKWHETGHEYYHGLSHSNRIGGGGSNCKSSWKFLCFQVSNEVLSIYSSLCNVILAFTIIIKVMNS